MRRWGQNLVQLAERCKHTVVVCNNGDKAGGSVEGDSGSVVGDDIRGVQFAGCCKLVVGVCDDRDKAGGG